MAHDLHSELREVLPFEEMTEESFEELVAMASDGKRPSGRWRRVLEAIRAWENAMDYTPCDYALDRIRDLECQVVLLRDELKVSSAVDRAGGRAPASSPPAL